MGTLPDAPQRLGRYEILDRLAVGGMAEVFLAMERGVAGLERLVVIKRIIPHLAIQDQFVEMFVREAKFIARINHPNIVQIYELGNEGGSFYMAMEYVPGVSLMHLMRAAALREEQVPVDVACSAIVQACSGLHAAHELTDANHQPLGLVHRDVTPHNVMVTAEGHVKVLDFGIAKATQIGAEQTKTGTLKGKVHYMSPEQCRQERVDRRSDVFALGIVLWELLTGHRLFKKKNDWMTMQAIVGGEVSDPRALRPDVPRQIAKAALAALEAEPSMRPASAEIFKSYVEQAAEQHGIKLSADVIRPYVADISGQVLERTRAEVEKALERTLALPPDQEDTRIERSDEVSARPLPAVAPLQPAGFVDPPIERISTTASDSRPVSTTRQEPSRVKKKASRPSSLIFVLLMVLGAALGGYGYLRWTKIAPPTSGPVIRFGFAPIMDPSRLLSDLEPLRVYLERRTGRPVEFSVAQSYGDLADQLLAGGVHYASLPPYTYLETKKRSKEIEVVALKLFDGSWGTDGVLIVPERTVDTILELKGKTWCFPDERSTTGFVLPRRAFRKAGIDPDKDLIKRRTGNHLQSLRDLNAGLCDVAGTYSGVILNAQAADISVAKLRTLEITGRAPADAFVAGPAAESSQVPKIKEALLTFSPLDETGVDTLGAVERISGFAEGSDAQYDGLRHAIEGIVVPKEPKQ